MTAIHDHRDPICGMQGSIPRHGRWFCSEDCAAAYATQQRQGGPRLFARLLNPWVWVPVTAAMTLAAGQWWPAAEPVSAVYRNYLRTILLPFLGGIVIGGMIDQFVPREYIVRYLTGSKKRVIARATVLGFLASTCSHGCLALAIELYRKGASTPAAISFLLASPWASMALTFLLLSLFGPVGLLFIAGALAIAFATGLTFQRLERAGKLDPNPHTVEVDEDFRLWEDVRARWRAYQWSPGQLARDAAGVLRGSGALGRMVLGWVQLGLLLSALMGGLAPHGAVARWFSPTPLGLGATLLTASVIEVCSEGSAPLAYELYRHTGALGNAFAFLMAGVVTDYTELAAVWKNMGKRTVGWLLAVAVPMVVLAGWTLNLVARR